VKRIGVYAADVGRGKGREERGGNKRMGDPLVLITGGRPGEERR
jgi:hypothetical protein